MGGGGSCRFPSGGGSCRCPSGGGSCRCPCGGGSCRCPSGGVSCRCPCGGGSGLCRRGARTKFSRYDCRGNGWSRGSSSWTSPQKFSRSRLYQGKLKQNYSSHFNQMMFQRD